MKFFKNVVVVLVLVGMASSINVNIVALALSSYQHQAISLSTSPRQEAEINRKILLISERIAFNLITNAISESGGYKWPIRLENTYYNPGFHTGAAGVGTFFLTLYNFTKNTTYLKYAEGAARWIISIARSAPNDSVTWCSFDDENCWFLTPDKDVSGIIKFLLRLYNTTKDPTYLSYAEKGANWIITSALVKDRAGVYVLYNPPRQAAFGVYSYVQRDVGTLMIDLYMVTKNTKYIEIARSIGDWIISTCECDQYVCKWYDDRGYGNLYTVEGTSSVADLLYELYQVTGDNRYLEVGERLVNWIERQGRRADSYGLKFPSYRGRYSTVIEGYWDRPFFPMTSADIFIKSYLITKNVSRLNLAEQYANWILSISTIQGNQAKVPFSEEQRTYHAWINARVFNFLATLYDLTSNTTYLDFMTKLLNYIESSAVEDDGYIWPRPDGRIWITFGLGEGSCAIGYYLLMSLQSLFPIESPTQIVRNPENVIKIIQDVRDRISMYRDLLDPAFYLERSEEYRKRIYEKSLDLLSIDETAIMKELVEQVITQYIPGLEYAYVTESLIGAMEVLTYMLADIITKYNYEVFRKFNYNSQNVLNDLDELLITLDEMIDVLESRDLDAYILLGQRCKEKIEIVTSKLAIGEHYTYLDPAFVSHSGSDFREPLIKLNRIASNLLTTMDILYIIITGTTLAERNFYTISKTALDLPYVSDFAWIVNGRELYDVRDGDFVVLKVRLRSLPFRSFSCEKIKIEVYEDIASWFDNVVVSRVFDLSGESLSEVNHTVEFRVMDKLFLRGYKFKVYGFGCGYPLSEFKSWRWIPLYFRPMKDNETYTFTHIPSYPPGLRVSSGFPLRGIIVSLTESGHRVHLRLEDERGRVLGYKEGAVRNDFEGASYIVLESGVVAVAPPSRYKITVDTSEMSEDRVYYNLTVLTIEDGEIASKQDYTSLTISRGEMHQYTVESLDESRPTEESRNMDWLLHGVLVLFSLTTATILYIAYIIIHGFKKHK